MEYYKKGQGLYARGLTVVGVLVVGLVIAQKVLGRMPLATDEAPYWSWLKYVIFALTWIAIGAPALYLCLFHPRISNYLIETQTELRKVSWSPWSEVVASTVVVIVTVAVTGALLFGVDQVLLKFLQFVRIY